MKIASDIPDMTPRHPEESDIIRFISGAGDEQELINLGQHINSCGVCFRTRSRILREIQIRESDISGQRNFQEQVWKRIRGQSL